MADEATVADSQEGNNPDERPSWLPENFKSPEDLVKSYNEAQNKIREQGSEINALSENYSSLAETVDQLQTQSTQVQQQQQVNPLIAQYQDAYERGDAAQMLAINAEISKMATQQALQQALPQVQQQYQTLAESQAQEISVYAANTLQQRYGPQFEQAKDAMAQILEANPHLIPETAKYDPSVAVNALDNVFRLATYGAAPQQEQGPSADEQKRLAQTATGAGTRVLSPDEQKQEWDAIRAAGPQPYWAGNQ